MLAVDIAYVVDMTTWTGSYKNYICTIDRSAL